MPLVGLFQGLDISASGLRAQRVRQNVIASNLANAETTRTPEGGPYRRQKVVLATDSTEFDQYLLKESDRIAGRRTDDGHMDIPQPKLQVANEGIGNGVKVVEITDAGGSPRLVYDPGHPDADVNGNVAMPDVNVVEEMVDMISATRAYEANATAFSSTKQMLMKALEL